jgi:large subunit ribosomal protein L40e
MPRRRAGGSPVPSAVAAVFFSCSTSHAGPLDRKSINGKTRTISVNSTDTIRQIKEQIRDKEGINPDEQRLIYAGKNLDDTKTVADYNLSADATLHLVLRVRGGE